MIEHKAFRPSLKATEDGMATVVIATFNKVDSDGDVTIKGFFGEQVAVIVGAHDWSMPSLGKARIYEQADEALADLKFNPDMPSAKEWLESIRFDFKNPPAKQQYSYGFTVLPGGATQGEFDGREVRFLGPLPDGAPGVEVHEVSPVLLGAGVDTRTLGVKGKLTFPQEIEQAREVLKALHKRAEGVLEWRKACGRPAELPKQRRAELAEVETMLAELSMFGSSLKGLLAEKPAAEVVDGARLLAEFERTKFDLSRMA